MSKCAQLYFLAKRERKQAAVMVPAGCPTQIAHVREIALELILVLVEQRQTPGAIARHCSAREQLVREIVVVGKQTARDIAERNDTGACQRRDVDHALWIEALGVRQCVRQGETAFGVGIEDLDRLAGHRPDDVAGTCRVAARHVLDRRDDANND